MASEAEVGHQRHVPDPECGVRPSDVCDALVVIGGTIQRARQGGGQMRNCVNEYNKENVTNNQAWSLDKEGGRRKNKGRGTIVMA